MRNLSLRKSEAASHLHSTIFYIMWPITAVHFSGCRTWACGL